MIACLRMSAVRWCTWCSMLSSWLAQMACAGRKPTKVCFSNSDKAGGCRVQACGGVGGVAALAAYRHQFVVRPAQVHALALRLLREDAAAAQVLGLPLSAGRGPVASVVTGGHLWLKVRSILVSLPLAVLGTLCRLVYVRTVHR